MYIWNINKLITALRENSLTEKQKKSYRTTFWVLLALSITSLPLLFDTSSMNKYDVIDLTAFVIINGLGLLTLISIHKKGNKNESTQGFMLPFVSLTIPLLLRYILLYTVLMTIGYVYILMFAPYHSMEETNLIDVIASILVEIYFNLSFIHYFKKIFN